MHASECLFVFSFHQFFSDSIKYRSTKFDKCSPHIKILVGDEFHLVNKTSWN